MPGNLFHPLEKFSKSMFILPSPDVLLDPLCSYPAAVRAIIYIYGWVGGWVYRVNSHDSSSNSHDSSSISHLSPTVCMHRTCVLFQVCNDGRGGGYLTGREGESVCVCEREIWWKGCGLYYPHHAGACTLIAEATHVNSFTSVSVSLWLALCVLRSCGVYVRLLCAAEFLRRLCARAP